MDSLLSMTHVNLGTGQVRYSRRWETTWDDQWACLSAYGAAQDKFVPMPPVAGYTMDGYLMRAMIQRAPEFPKGDTRGAGIVFIVTADDDDAVATLGLARESLDPRDGPGMWDLLIGTAKVPLNVPPYPQKPWVALRPDLGFERHMAVHPALAAFERALAWAWVDSLDELDRVRAQREEQPPIPGPEGSEPASDPSKTPHRRTFSRVAAIPVFFCDEMLAISDSRSPSAEKPKPVVESWLRTGFPIELRSVLPATIEQLCLAHDAAFVRSVLACQTPNGFGNTREDVARSLPFTNGSMLQAARCALESGIACAPTGGFHHAGYDTASMFCTFNGLMVAAATLLQEGACGRILILDCDYHYGNGTDEIIERLGLASKVENATFGRTYRRPSEATLYLQQLRRVIGRFNEFDLVIYQAGVDVHVRDPMGGVLDTGQITLRDRLVFEGARNAGIPLAWNLAGGYQVPVTKVIALHHSTMEECVWVYVAS